LRRTITLSWSSVILAFLKNDKEAVLKSSNIEGVRFPFSKIGAFLPPMKVVKGARPGIAGTVVEDMETAKEESEEVVEVNESEVLGSEEDEVTREDSEELREVESEELREELRVEFRDERALCLRAVSSERKGGGSKLACR
jgi:hypothetical protein